MYTIVIACFPTAERMLLIYTDFFAEQFLPGCFTGFTLHYFTRINLPFCKGPFYIAQASVQQPSYYKNESANAKGCHKQRKGGSDFTYKPSGVRTYSPSYCRTVRNQAVIESGNLCSVDSQTPHREGKRILWQENLSGKMPLQKKTTLRQRFSTAGGGDEGAAAKSTYRGRAWPIIGGYPRS